MKLKYVKRSIVYVAIVALVLAALAGFSHAGEAKHDPFAPYRAIAQTHTLAGSQCSATLIAIGEDGRGLMLSARHCGRTGTIVKVQFRNTHGIGDGGFESNGRVVATLSGQGFDTDQALITIDRCPPGVAPVPVSRFNAGTGPWVAVGFRGDIMRVSVAPSQQARDDGLLVHPRPFVGGMSGGALLDSRGHLVGIVVATDVRGRWGLSSNGPTLWKFLEDFNAGKL